MAGDPGLTSWPKAMPTMASARIWDATAAGVTGAIAPARMNGVKMHAWFSLAYTSAAPSIVPSQVRGEAALMSEVNTVRPARSPPKAMRAISTESSARSGAVTDPMSALFESVRCASSMSRWRVGTGSSTGSHSVPPP